VRIVLGNQVINPPVLLAPLAGITDVPFRNLVQSFGAGLVVSEMVASHEMVQKKPGVRERAELGFGIASTSVQIAGREAYWMAEAARMIESNGAKIIDINMGCPAKKVTSGQSGSALMRTPDFALELVEAVVKATSLDVTLKMRLGWDDNSLNAPYIAARAEAAGIKMITVHGRTRCQFYNGAANWAAISQVKAAVSIPVIANGDIVDVASARLALEQSGADGIMVGRGAQGAPWRLAEISSKLYGTPEPIIPRGNPLGELIIGHHQAILDFYGKVLGVKNARKHLGWYLDGLQVTPELRQSLLRSVDLSEIHQLIWRAVQQGRTQVAA
jgi:tRNA-dihydrouridine synthase B|tara:strand:- start:4389 stop:5375 length:987 start_codon:yes stop_codon:yes gene_type:complete